MEGKSGCTAARETESIIIASKVNDLKDLTQQTYTLVNDKLYSYSQSKAEAPANAPVPQCTRTITSPYFCGVNDNLELIERWLRGIIEAIQGSEL